MAIKLVAKLSVNDGFTGPMSRIRKSMNDTEKSAARMSDKMKDINRIFNKFGKNANEVKSPISNLTKKIGGLGGGLVSIVSKLNPVALGITAIGTAAAGAYSAVKVFNATVGEAMKMQQSQVVISAMFDDKKASSQYMKMMDKLSVKSPILDSQTMYGNSKSFVSVSKDLGQLEKMWKLTEKLAASDPAQGVEGAVFALRELFSGDAVSLVERFEMPRAIMNDIKKLPLDQQLTKLDQYFNKIGLTTKLIDDMGGTALGKWTQVKERFQLVMRDMGEPALNTVSTFLDKVLSRLESQDMQKFGQWGGKVINSMLTGLTNNAVKIYDYFTNLQNDPEFQSRTTIAGKINFVVDDIAAKLQAWYEGGGKDKLISFGSTVASVLVGAMDATDEVFTLGSKIGNSVWQGVLSGIKKSASESDAGKLIQFLIGGGGNAGAAVDKYKKEYEAKNGKGDGKTGFQKIKDKFSKSHSGGLDRVPYDGYQATLHKDEKILTAQNAREYREGNSGVSVSVGQLIIQGGGDMKAQAREFLNEVATLLEQEGGQMA